MSANQYIARIAAATENAVADTLLAESVHERLLGVDPPSMTLSAVAVIVGISLLVHRVRSK